MLLEKTLLQQEETTRRSNQSILKEIRPEYSLEEMNIPEAETEAEVEAETPILWPPHAKSWLIWKNPDAKKDWGQEKKGMAEDEMVGWHHPLNGHQFE